MCSVLNRIPASQRCLTKPRDHNCSLFCLVWSLSNALQQVYVTFRERPSSATTSIIGFAGGYSVPFVCQSRWESCGLRGVTCLGWAELTGNCDELQKQHKPFSFAAWNLKPRSCKPALLKHGVQDHSTHLRATVFDVPDQPHPHRSEGWRPPRY